MSPPTAADRDRAIAHDPPRARPRRHLPRHRRHLRPGHNEELVGEAIAGRRDEVVLATKFGIRRTTASCAAIDGRPEYVRRPARRRCAGSASTHRPLLPAPGRPDVPIEDTVGAMAELVAAGQGALPRPVGGSARTRSAGPPPCTRSPRCRASGRCGPATSRARSLPTCREHGIGIVPFSPLGRGFLTGALTTSAFADDDFRRTIPRFTGDDARAQPRAGGAWSGRSPPRRRDARPGRRWPGCWPRATTSSRSRARSAHATWRRTSAPLEVEADRRRPRRRSTTCSRARATATPDMTWVERNTPTPAR